MAQHRFADAGIARTFQSIRLFPTLSLYQNVQVAALSTQGGKEAAARTRAALAGLGLEARAETDAGTLSYGDQRRVEIAALLGANDAGKSSTMNAVAGLVWVASGKAVFDGRNITDLPPEAIPVSGRTLSPEGRRVFGTLTVEDNLRTGAYALGDAGAVVQPQDRVFALFPILEDRRKKWAGTLSGGQQQMLAIGRALMCSRRLLLLDEPSLDLAPRVVEQVFDLLETLRDQGVTICLVEQNVAGALEIADRAHMMASGAIVGQGTAAEMGSRTADA